MLPLYTDGRVKLNGAALALLFGRLTMGQIIYDNGGPDHTSGVEMTTTIQAEQFTLSGPVDVSGIHFWDIDNLASYNGSIVWTIYSDGGIQPGSILFRGTATAARTPTGIMVAGLDEFQNDLEIPPLPLSAGTYWLGLHNGPLTTPLPPHFFWETTAPNGTQMGNDDAFPFDDGVWQGGFQERAFYLTTGTVPESSISGMLVVSVFGMISLFKAMRRPDKDGLVQPVTTWR